MNSQIVTERAPTYHPGEDDPLELLGPEPDSEFNDLAELAAAVCGTPMSTVTLLGAEWQYHKGSIGMETVRIPRSQSFCHYTVMQDSTFVVADPQGDPRFARNPAVTSEPGLRFYAGVPVYSPAGLKIGALCVLDTVHRELKPMQKRSLSLLARQVTARLELACRRLRDEVAAAR